MIKIINDILLKSEMDLMTKIYENFQSDQKPKNNNYYERMHVSEEHIINGIEEIKQILEEQEKRKYMLLPNRSTWINKVNKETNQKDNFHLDSSIVTAIIYLNDNFIGGDFEYLDEEGRKNIIKPKKNMGLIINNKIRHRVLPVSEGERFSLICFFEEEFSKTKKTLL
jgi:hypothetical protein